MSAQGLDDCTRHETALTCRFVIRADEGPPRDRRERGMNVG
jgi:hypothetical protein